MEVPAQQGTVFIVEDDERLRRSLQQAIQEGDLPVETFRSESEFLAQLDVEQPGCVVVKLSLPDMDGLEVHRQLRRRGADLPVILVSAEADVPTAVAAMREGVSDFLELPFDPVPLRAAVRRALESDRAIRRSTAERRQIKALLERLTAREREVIRLAATGLTNKAIAERLSVSSQAIDARRANAMSKLNVDNVAQLVRFAVKAEEVDLLEESASVSGRR